jgi:AcrR family transcriptional regulator
MARTAGSHSDITGPRVRAAALRLFARHGFAAVSMRQIAAEVGVQVGALYNYTPDKQTMLFDLMKGHMDELLAARAALPAVTGPQAALEQFVSFHIRFHLERPEAMFIAYMELRSLEPGNFAVIEAMRRGYEDQLEAILRAAQAAGLCALRDTRIATLAVIGLLNGVNTWYRSGGRLSLEEVQGIYRDMVCGAVGIARG